MPRIPGLSEETGSGGAEESLDLSTRRRVVRDVRIGRGGGDGGVVLEPVIVRVARTSDVRAGRRQLELLEQVVLWQLLVQFLELRRRCLRAAGGEVNRPSLVVFGTSGDFLPCPLI